MDNKQYNEQRYNRKKHGYRIRLGMQQLINYPAINLIWILFGVGIIFVVHFQKVILLKLDISPMLDVVFAGCIQFITIFSSIICAGGIMELIGQMTAMRDEADISLVFGDNRNIMNLPPILVYKKRIKKKGITIREFYTTIPMERWQEKKEAICDIMNVHLVGDIEYGGKCNGNRIVMKSVKGRKVTEKGVIYDDTF